MPWPDSCNRHCRWDCQASRERLGCRDDWLVGSTCTALQYDIQILLAPLTLSPHKHTLSRPQSKNTRGPRCGHKAERYP
jgi:hypothetical protein